MKDNLDQNVEVEMKDDEALLSDIFQEPEGYYKQPDPARWIEHTLPSGEKLQLRLVGQGPMWVLQDFFLS